MDALPCYFCRVGRFPYHVLVIAGAVGLFASAPAQAAQLEFVDQATWGADGVPSWVNMYIYVPDNVADNPPILLVAQSCGDRSAPDFFVDQNVVTTRNQADANGYIVILPEHTNRNCFDSGSTESLTRDGGGDTEAFIQMVRYTLETYNGDPERVYIAGGSGGGMMTQAMLAVYPDVFKAGASRAGAPAGCWGVVGSTGGYMEGQQWNADCAGGAISMSAQEWGDLVRSMNPDYTGPHPRVQLFHASMDETINYNNMGEGIKQWTNVLGLPEAPTSEGQGMTSMATYNREQWSDDCGYTVLDAWHYSGGDHSFPSYEWTTMLEFFGLNVPAGGLDPRDEACPDAGTTTGGTETGGDAETGDDGADTTGADGTTESTGVADTSTDDSETTEGEASTSAAEESTTTEENSSGDEETTATDDESSDEEESGDEEESSDEDGGGSTEPAATGGSGCACTVDGDEDPGSLGNLGFALLLLGFGRQRLSRRPRK